MRTRENASEKHNINIQSGGISIPASAHPTTRTSPLQLEWEGREERIRHFPLQHTSNRN